MLNIYQLPWAEVKREMTNEKGLDPAVADKIGEYVKHKGRFVNVVNGKALSKSAGGPALLEQLTADQTLMSNKNAKEGLADMGLLFTLLKAYKVLDKVWPNHFL